VGENMIRVSGPDAKGNVGLFPIYDNLRESTFLLLIGRDAPSHDSRDDGDDLACGAVAADTNLYVFPTTAAGRSPSARLPRRAAACARPATIEELVPAGILYNMNPARIRFEKPVRGDRRHRRARRPAREARVTPPPTA
jgi:hypothetical protein